MYEDIMTDINKRIAEQPTGANGPGNLLAANSRSQPGSSTNGLQTPLQPIQTNGTNGQSGRAETSSNSLQTPTQQNQTGENGLQDGNSDVTSQSTEMNTTIEETNLLTIAYNELMDLLASTYREFVE